MSREDLLLAPESLETLLQGLSELGPALGPAAAPGLGRVQEFLEAAVVAQRDGRRDDAMAAITGAMQALATLADAMDPAEATLMRAVAGQFTQAMQRGDGARAAASVDEMRERSGARKKRGDENQL